MSKVSDASFFAEEKPLLDAGNGVELIEFYLRRIDAGAAGREKAELLCKISRVFDKLLDDPNQAFDALLVALELEVDNANTDRELAALATRTGRWVELIQAVNGWEAAEKEPTRKIAICFLLARWYGEELERPEYAMAYFKQVLALDANQVPVLRAMARAMAKKGDLRRQGMLLVQALESSDDASEQAALRAEIDTVRQQLDD